MEAGRDALASRGGRPVEVFTAALRLGLTAFGGPTAHIGLFRNEYVDRRRWIDERAFSELVAVTSLLPGPSSSQLGIAIGAHRAGKLGGLLAWFGFTAPSAIVMTLFGLGIASAGVLDSGWVQGLQLVPVPIVLLAVISMQRALAPDPARLGVAVAAGALALWAPAGQVLAIVAAGALGALAFRGLVGPIDLHLRSPISRRFGLFCAALLAALLLGLPVLADRSGHALRLTDSMVRAGSLVVGGGHVVLPLLHAATVDDGWVSEHQFLVGYGAVQAVPGPLFTFSAYLGAVEEPAPNGVPGAAIALGAIFLPAFLMLGIALPFWSSVRSRPVAQAALTGVGAAVVGVLAAALWDPVLTTAVGSPSDVAFAVVLLGLLRVLPTWAVVALAAALGALVL